MLREMRFPEKKMKCSDAVDILLSAKYGVLCLNGENDYAYGIPLCFIYVGDCLYFHCAHAGQKIDYIHKNNKVSFNVVGEVNPVFSQHDMKYKSVIVFGKVSEVDENVERFKALVVFVEKYAHDHKEKGIDYIVNNGHNVTVLRLDIEHISGKTGAGESLPFIRKYNN